MPAQPGASFSATASGPAVLSGPQTGTLNTAGTAQVNFDIGLFGTYTINGSVTAGTGTAMTSTTVNVTAAPGAGC